MSFTKATLTTAIQDYTDNSETTFVNNIPNFIKASEEKILKSVDLDYFRKNVTSALTLSDEFLTVPSDYLASFSLQITTSGSESFLLQKDVNFLRRWLLHLLLPFSTPMFSVSMADQLYNHLCFLLPLQDLLLFLSIV